MHHKSQLIQYIVILLIIINTINISIVDAENTYGANKENTAIINTILLSKYMCCLSSKSSERTRYPYPSDYVCPKSLVHEAAVFVNDGEKKDVYKSYYIELKSSPGTYGISYDLLKVNIIKEYYAYIPILIVNSPYPGNAMLEMQSRIKIILGKVQVTSLGIQFDVLKAIYGSKILKQASSGSLNLEFKYENEVGYLVSTSQKFTVIERAHDGESLVVVAKSRIFYASLVHYKTCPYPPGCSSTDEVIEYKGSQQQVYKYENLGTIYIIAQIQLSTARGLSFEKANDAIDDTIPVVVTRDWQHSSIFFAKMKAIYLKPDYYYNVDTTYERHTMGISIENLKTEYHMVGLGFSLSAGSIIGSKIGIKHIDISYVTVGYNYVIEYTFKSIKESVEVYHYGDYIGRDCKIVNMCNPTLVIAWMTCIPKTDNNERMSDNNSGTHCSVSGGTPSHMPPRRILMR